MWSFWVIHGKKPDQSVCLRKVGVFYFFYFFNLRIALSIWNMLDVHCYLGSTAFDTGRSFNAVTLVEVGIWRLECPKKFPVKFPYHPCMVYLPWFFWVFMLVNIQIPWMLSGWFGRSCEKKNINLLCPKRTSWASLDWPCTYLLSRLKIKQLCGGSTVLEKYMAQSLHSGLYWPFTSLPFGICAIYSWP